MCVCVCVRACACVCVCVGVRSIVDVYIGVGQGPVRRGGEEVVERVVAHEEARLQRLYVIILSRARV